jgi:hypothetical protein
MTPLGFRHSEESMKKMSEVKRGNHYALGHKHSEESIRKMSEAKMGHPVSEETRNKLSIARKGKFLGEEHPMWGKHHSEESKRKMSLHRTGKCCGPENPNYHKIFSPETLLKMSFAQKGKKASEETKRKMSESMKKNMGNINRARERCYILHSIPFSCQTREKISLSKIGPKNPSWKGGRIIDNNGYIRILCHDHPSADKYGYVPEHRLVAEKVLGRVLKATEVIHHINEIRHDNIKNNLVICQNNSYHHLLHRRMRRAMEALDEKLKK